MHKIKQIDRIVNVSPSNPSGYWESEESVGKAWYDSELGEIHLGSCMVYGAHHHYPSGNPDVDVDLKREIEERAVQWASGWDKTPEFPWPIKAIYVVGHRVE